MANVLDSEGKKLPHCRLFLDGYPVECLTVPVGSRVEPAQIEIILLIAPEGG